MGCLLEENKQVGQAANAYHRKHPIHEDLP